VLDDRQLEAVSALCRRLDGLPLAIELAAARVRSMTPVDLVAGLDERFRVLVGNRRSRTERHQTMRATLDWSYSLCDPVEQEVFDRLSVFPADFDTSAAAVVAGEGLSAFAVQDALGRLVDRSLVTSDVGDDGTARFRMLETMRAYGRERLRDTGDADAVRERHARHIADEVEQLAASVFGPDENAAVQRIEQLLADIVLTVNWFVEHDQLEQAMRLPSPVGSFRFREARAMYELIRSAASPSNTSVELRAEFDLNSSTCSALTDDEIAARLRILAPRPDRDVFGFAGNRVEMSDNLAAEVRRFPERFASARPLNRYGVLFWCCGGLITANRISEALELLDEFEAFAESTDSEFIRTGLVNMRARIAGKQGDWARAANQFDQVVSGRSGLNELSIGAVSARFSAISTHTLAGDTVTMSEVRNAWDALEGFGYGPPSARAASATAIWLAARDQRDLGLRFLRWAARLDNDSALVPFANELSYFDLPTNPDGPDEQLEPLINQLDFL
jgi:hypothetical protein